MLYIWHGYVDRIKVDVENMLGAKYRLSHGWGEPTNRFDAKSLFHVFMVSPHNRFSFSSFLSRKTASLLSIRTVNKHTSGDQCICRQTDVGSIWTLLLWVWVHISLGKFLSTHEKTFIQSAIGSLRV